MTSKCFRKGCNWVLDVAHMDEALDQLRQHYRAVHPTKVFWENDIAGNLESYNQTADELMENFNMARGDQPEYDWRHLQSTVRSHRSNQERGLTVFLHSDTVDELERRVNEHYANNPAPAPDEAMPRLAQAFQQYDAGIRAEPPPFDDGLVEVDLADPF